MVSFYLGGDAPMGVDEVVVERLFLFVVYKNKGVVKGVYIKSVIIL